MSALGCRACNSTITTTRTRQASHQSRADRHHDLARLPVPTRRWRLRWRGAASRMGSKGYEHTGEMACPQFRPQYRRPSGIPGGTRRTLLRPTHRHYDTGRHTPNEGVRVGLGLQNRRLQVRFLSHLPVAPEFMGITLLWLQHSVCALTPITYHQLHHPSYLT